METSCNCTVYCAAYDKLSPEVGNAGDTWDLNLCPNDAGIRRAL